MVKTTTRKQFSTVFLIPMLLLVVLVVLLNSPQLLAREPKLYTYITIDFIISIPLIYFLLIRKRNISKLSVAPVFILCVIIASYTIPNDNQDVLRLAKTWLIPIVKIGVLTLVVIKVRKAIKYFKETANTHDDFYSTLMSTCESMFPKTAAKLVANEIALFYFGFFNFRKIHLKSNEYSNYEGSGILSTLGAIIVVIIVEMVGIHLLAAKWNNVLAWTLTALSAYSALQIIGIIRSVPKRPIAIHKTGLQLRFGILSNTHIPFEAIAHIGTVNSDDYNTKKDKNTKTLSLLGDLEHSNVCIQLKSPQRLQFIYGKPRLYTKLFLFVDDHQRFTSEVEAHLSK